MTLTNRGKVVFAAIGVAFVIGTASMLMPGVFALDKPNELVCTDTTVMQPEGYCINPEK